MIFNVDTFEPKYRVEDELATKQIMPAVIVDDKESPFFDETFKGLGTNMSSPLHWISE